MKNNFTLIVLFLLTFVFAGQAQFTRPRSRVLSAKEQGEAFKKIELFNYGQKKIRNRSIKIPKEFKNYQLLSLNREALRNFSSKGSAPKTMSISLPNQSSVMILELVRVQITTDDFSIAELPSGRTIKPIQIDHYRGIVKNKRNSRVAVSIQENEVSAIISLDDTVGNFVLGKLSDSDDHIIYRDKDISHLNDFVCQVDESYRKTKQNDAELKASEPASGKGKCPKIFFDIADDVVSDKGGVNAASAFVEAMFNQVAILYNNEGINIKLSGIRAWSSRAPFNDLDSYRSYRNRNQFNGDLGHLLTYNYSGGVAWVSGLCSSYKYGLSGIYRNYTNVPRYSWNISTIAHELGHNFGSSHTHACVWNGNNTAIDGCYQTEGNCRRPGAPSDGGTIMSYCHLSSVGTNLRKGFASQPANVIRRTINNGSCVDTCSTDGGGDNGDDEISCAGVDAWTDNINYSSGDKVVYNGRLFERTGNSSWNDLGTCSSDDCYGVAAWSENTSYSEGDVIIYQGNLFKRTNGDWVNLGACDNQDSDPCSGIEAWSDNTSYRAGDKVVYQGRAFEWTGNEWSEIAVCSNQPGASIDEITMNNDIKTSLLLVYPNPVRDLMNFQIKGIDKKTTLIKIMDTQGKLLINKRIDSISPLGTLKGTINVGVLTKGVHFIQVINGKKKIIKKFMIE